MWSHYNTNNNTPRQQQQNPHRHNEYERMRNTNNDPLSALAAYTLDPSANATAFAAASSVNTHHSHHNPPDYYYSSSTSPTNQQHYHRNESSYYMQHQQHQQHDYHHYQQQRQAQYNEYENQQQESSSSEEEEEQEEDNIEKMNRAHQQHQQEQSDEDDESEEEEEQKPTQLFKNNITTTTASKGVRMPELDYECISTLLTQFCKVPLLSEFLQPVSKLHPELMSAYSKVVKYPMDLSKVCRRFHNQNYYPTKESFQVDMWRIFTNCILFHSHPTANKHGHAIPSFISLALHLREFFNALWDEYVIPSDEVLQKREDGRKLRLYSISTTLLTVKCMRKAAGLLFSFIESHGMVDRLDKPLRVFQESGVDKDGAWSKQVHYALKALRSKILQMAENNEVFHKSTDGQRMEMEYSMENLKQDLDSIASQSPNPSGLKHRLDRLLGQIVVPVYETNCRGVNQSSIWGCMAAAIWARESSKKRFWPALVLGILAPDYQKEDWHVTLTERNEARLPERLRQDLQVAKRKAESSIEKQTYQAKVSGHSIEVQSYFLVEFMGKHEFTWVREADIIENFDPSQDPNAASTNKKRSTSSTAFLNAINEGKWAMEEFELQLRDPCGDLYSGEDDDDEAQSIHRDTSFKRLCQSQPEDGDDYSVQNIELEQMKKELRANKGLISFSSEGLKPKAKSAEVKESRKQQPSSSSKKKKKAATAIDEEKEMRKIAKEIESERKRAEKEAKTAAAAAKKKKVSSHEKKKKTPEKKKATPASNDNKKISDKRYRAEMVIQGYLSKIAKENDSKDLSLSVFMTNPDSFGLLGMALAFRAAANDIDWNDPSDPQNLKKPWEKLELDHFPTTRKERCALLKKQIALVEKELDELSKAQERRRELMDAAEDSVGRYFNKMAELDQNARVVPSSLKRKKKPATPGSGKASKKPKIESPSVVETSHAINDNGCDDDDVDSQAVSHTEVIRTPAPSTLDDDDDESEEEGPVIMREEEESVDETDDDEEDGRLNDTALSDDEDSDEDDD